MSIHDEKRYWNDWLVSTSNAESEIFKMDFSTQQATSRVKAPLRIRADTCFLLSGMSLINDSGLWPAEIIVEVFAECRRRKLPVGIPAGAQAAIEAQMYLLTGLHQCSVINFLVITQSENPQWTNHRINLL